MLKSVIISFAVFLAGGVFVMISLIAAKKKIRFEEKYHILFWIGLGCLMVGGWYVFHKIFT